MPLTSQWLLLAAGNRALITFLPLVIVALIFTATVTAITLATQREKKRTAAFKQAADQLGFEFFPKGDPTYQQALANAPLCSRGTGKKLTNLLRGSSASLQVGIFDYRYITGSGQHSQTWRQTALSIQSPAMALPDLVLSPKSFWTRVGSYLGQQSIEFDTHPAFSEAYLLRSDDVDAVRKLFNPKVLEYFEQNPGWNVEGSTNRLLIYKAGKRTPPADTAVLLEDGLGMLRLLCG
jgi:hypothetical protein